MEIKILSYSPGPLKIDEKVKEVVNKKSNISFQVYPIIRSSKGSDILGFQIDLQIIYYEKVFVSLGFLLGLEVKGWSEVVISLISQKSGKEILDKVEELSTPIWEYIRIITATRISDKIDIPIMLPEINIKEFAQLVAINVVESPDQISPKIS